MPPINPQTVQVIDPILSTHAQGYRHPERVGHLLFPAVPHGTGRGQVLQFGKESFRLYAARRAPGGATKRVQFGYLGALFAMVQDALEGIVPREWLRDAAAVPGIDLGRRSVNMVMDNLTLALEHEQAQIARTAASYDAFHKIALAGGTKWSADTGKPLTNIADGREAVRRSTGMDANTLVLSPGAWNAAKANPQVTERFKFTQSGPITLQQFGALVEIERIAVGKAVYAGAADTFVDVWGSDAVLAYVPPAPEGMEQPSYGYTYTMIGNPAVEQTYYSQNDKSWIYPVTYERAPVMSAMTAGYLIQDCD